MSHLVATIDRAEWSLRKSALRNEYDECVSNHFVNFERLFVLPTWMTDKFVVYTSNRRSSEDARYLKYKISALVQIYKFVNIIFSPIVTICFSPGGLIN